MTFVTVAVAGTLLVAGRAEAAAQCIECRAVAYFRTCDKPVEGKRVFQGRAVRVDVSGCSQLLSLDVVRPADVGLPARIQVALGPCATWEGRFDDVIDIAVSEPLSVQSSVYTLACRHW